MAEYAGMGKPERQTGDGRQTRDGIGYAVRDLSGPGVHHAERGRNVM